MHLEWFYHGNVLNNGFYYKNALENILQMKCIEQWIYNRNALEMILL